MKWNLVLHFTVPNIAVIIHYFQTINHSAQNHEMNFSLGKQYVFKL